MDNALIKKYIAGTATEQEVSMIRDYLMIEKNRRCYYDIIFKMRIYAMRKLKIKCDFIGTKKKRKTEL
ncbi:MAG: hypothetical protein LBP56_08760 [Odoribacteraceae bacterium]|jgi:hypothetical protein|nr:hypothetical protein [Odoribacteraceae bacterium]